MSYTDLQRLHLSEDKDPDTRGPKWFQQPVSSRLIALLLCVCAGLIIVNIVVTASTRGSGASSQDSDYSEELPGQDNGKDGFVQKLISSSRGRGRGLPPENETYDGACPDDWSQFQQSCYFFSNLDKSWMEAHRMCQRRKAQLTVINTAEEQAFLTKLAMKIRVWIGLSEINGEWKWVDGTPYSSTPKKWATGQPDEYYGHGYGGGEDCAQLLYSGDWNDEHCSRTYRYICEKKAVQ